MSHLTNTIENNMKKATIKKAILKKAYWCGMQNANYYAYYPVGTEVTVKWIPTRRASYVVLPPNEFDQVRGGWQGNRETDLEFVK